MKTVVCSLDGDIEIVAGVIQGDILEPYMFIIFLDDVLRKSISLIKENSFTLKKTREAEGILQKL